MFRAGLTFVLTMLWLGCATAAPAEPIAPVPRGPQPDPARVEIGRRLFQDTRLSANGGVSCASCHDLAHGGADRRPRSTGFDGRQTEFNTPTVLNAALNFRQFWDGRAESLEAQVGLVVENPIEMGSRWVDVVAKVAGDAWYKAAFAAAFGDGVTRANIESALATFERSLVTRDSRFDTYLRGDRDALSAQERAGYLKFKQFGCVACHQGVNVGGNMFQKFGVMGDYFADRGGASPSDLGRYRVTRKESDRHVFKVPSLRNIEHTAPYFHDGSAGSLEQAVGVMFRYQLGRSASADDIAAIVSFLRTLSALPEAAP